jgi:hypothetical protein
MKALVLREEVLVPRKRRGFQCWGKRILALNDERCIRSEVVFSLLCIYKK